MKTVEVTFVTANARSIISKTQSMIDLFEDLELQFMLINETWLSGGESLENQITDLDVGAGIGFLHKSRRDRNGGGVAIAYRKNGVTFKKIALKRNNFEVVAGIASISKTPRKLIVFSVYLPPSMPAVKVRECFNMLQDNILEMTQKHENPVIVIGGDFNRSDPTALAEPLPGIEVLQTGPTRGVATLDHVYTNGLIETACTRPPLQSISGTYSDHLSIQLSVKIELFHKFEKVSFLHRPITEKGKEKFVRAVVLQQWNEIYCGNASAAAEKLCELLDKMYHDCFPEIRVQYKTTDNPWINKKIRGIAKKKRKEYKKKGKSDAWWDLTRKMKESIATEKARYLEKMKEKAKSQRSSAPFFKAVKALQNVNCVKQWSLFDLYPELDRQAAVDTAALAFNGISDEFVPLTSDFPNIYMNTKLRQAYGE